MRPAALRTELGAWDEQSLARCRRGEREALEQVLGAELPALEKTLGRLVGSRVELEDLMQQTLLQAVRSFPRFRGEASVRTWLVSIGVRTALARLKANKRSRLELVEADAADWAPSPDETLEDRRRLGRVREHLQAIAPKKRVAFVLHVIEGRPIDEVAVLVGASLAATKSRVYFARRELTRRMRRDPALADLLGGGDEG